MKIFNKGSGWEEKVNFVDKNNVFVGYDRAQTCCEHASWFISDKEENEDREDNGINTGLEDYIFDTGYFKEVEPKKEADDSWSCLDQGGMVRFKLIADNKPDLYLHIFNSHSGHYGHGFEAKIGDTSWKKGWL